MKRIFCIAITVVLLTGLQACNDTRKSKNYNDRTLIDDTGLAMVRGGIESGNAEVAFSKLALRNSQNRNIVDFANMMITDHTEVGTGLKKIAEDKKVTVNDSLSVPHKELLDSLTAKKGTDFDHAYMQIMVADHEKAVEIFKGAAGNTDKTINKFAKNVLPKLEKHLEEANKLCARLK